MRAHVMCDGHYTCEQKGALQPFRKPEASAQSHRRQASAAGSVHDVESTVLSGAPSSRHAGVAVPEHVCACVASASPPRPLPCPARRGAHTWPFPCWLPGGPPARRGSTVTPAGARGPCMTDSRLPRKRARVPEGSTWFQRPRSARTPVSRSPHHGGASGPD